MHLQHCSRYELQLANLVVRLFRDLLDRGGHGELSFAFKAGVLKESRASVKYHFELEA